MNKFGCPEAAMEENNHAVLLPAFGMGHLIPMVEFAKRLSILHDFSVTIIVSDWTATYEQIDKVKSRIASNPEQKIYFKQLPPIDLSDQEKQQNTDMPRPGLVMDKSKSLVHQALREIASQRDSKSCPFITDFFCTMYFEIAQQLEFPVHVFFVSSASFLSLMLYAPVLEEQGKAPISSENSDDDITVPGLPPIPPHEMPQPFVMEKATNIQWFLGNCHLLPQAKGFLINTCLPMEHAALQVLQDGMVLESKKNCYYPVGPLIQSRVYENTDTSEREECLKWLDMQPNSSVVYVSFGSMARLSPEQIVELAYGLEDSCVRFLWVLQKPVLPTILNFKTQIAEGEDIKSYLPKGFEMRTRERGIVVCSWAPQAEILEHSATGGYVCHCGWNSTLECILNGVPVLAWPLAAEQHMNAILIADVMRVGLRVKSEEGIVRREEVFRGLRELMVRDEDGRVVRENMKKLSEEARCALAPDGSSSEALAAVVAEWKSLVI